MVFDVFVVDSPWGYNLGKINDIVQSTQKERECAQIMNMYIYFIRRRPKIEFCGSYFGYSMVMFDFVLFVCLFVAAAAAVVASACFNICDTFIHLLKTNICKH